MKRYPAYKDSGIEWIGEIPTGWENIKLKYIMQNFDGRRIPLSSEQRAEMQGDYSYYGSNGIVDHVNDYLFDGEYILLGEDGAPFFEAYKDVAFLVKGKFWVNNHAHILKAFKGHDQRFLTYTLNCVNYRRHITGSTRDKLTQDDMSSIELPIAKYVEQKAIADHLDRKTAQIDDLIAKKERMIELLKEERTVIINQAVTKGVDPNVETKDSGIEWLGKVPKQWEIKRLKFIFKIVNGATPKSTESDFWDGGISWVTPDDFSNARADGTLAESRRQITSAGYQSCGTTLAQSRSIIVSTRAPIGYVAILGKDMCCNQGCRILVKRYLETNERFFYYYFSVCVEALNSLGEGSTFKELSRDKLAIFYLLNPAVKEQQQIVEFLDHKTVQIDIQIDRERRLIELLKEYRTALISEVVTGKIDVREDIA